MAADDFASPPTGGTEERGAGTDDSETQSVPTLDAAPTKAADIKTLPELLMHAYEAAGKRLTVPRNVCQVVTEAISGDTTAVVEETSGLAAELATQDPFVAVPQRLLVAVESAAADLRLRRALADVFARVLEGHAAFRRKGILVSAISSREEANGVFSAVRASVDLMSASEAGLEKDRFSRADRERLTANANTALALVLAIRNGWSIDVLVGCLADHLWFAALARTDRRRLRAILADSRTPEALGVVAEVFGADVRKLAARIEAAELGARAASERATDAERIAEEMRLKFDASLERIRGLEHEIKELGDALTAEREARRIDRSHLVDDYEGLRTRIVRMLRSQSDLLADGLHALRNDRTAVVDEYLDRALASLSKELKQLTEERGV